MIAKNGTIKNRNMIQWRFQIHSLYETNMDKLVTCPHCGKKYRFGDMYTSHEFHNNVGFGYVVCRDCYNDIEWPRYYEDLKRKNKN